MSTTTGAARVVILDVDGVVSPIGGASTPWGDDVVAGDVSGPALVSPTLCARLDELGQAPGVSCVWLTSWSPEMRGGLHPFPGKDWPVVPDPSDSRPPEHEWWKLAALEAWLDHHPEVRDLAWCDDHLLGDRPAVARGIMRQSGLTPLLLTPLTEVGLTPKDMDLLAAWASA